MAFKKTKLEPKQKSEKIITSYKIDKDLHNSVKEKLKKNNHSLSDLIKFTFENYLKG
jgi:hypothetical protein